MGRGVSSGGGKSSLDYLFGDGNETTNTAPPTKNDVQVANDAPPHKPAANVLPTDKGIPAGIHGSPTNNYLRADGQNCGNFITDRPSTKVHAAPGGGSSLGYLFGVSGN